VDLEGVPRDPATGALQFQSFDFLSGKQALPLVKLIDDFKVGWVPGLCVREGEQELVAEGGGGGQLLPLLGGAAFGGG
jgi:hypothetical protein